jgi:hypothetical protein
MTPDESNHWDVVIARIRKHKEKCDYHEPEMLAILAADAELKRLREAVDDSRGIGVVVHEAMKAWWGYGLKQGTDKYVGEKVTEYLRRRAKEG